MKFTGSQTLQNLQRRQFLLYILIFSLVTIIIWAIFSLIVSQKKVPIPPELLRLSQPLTPSLDEQVILDLENKKNFSARELENFPIYTIITTQNGLTKQLVTLDEAVAESKRQELERKAQLSILEEQIASSEGDLE